MEPRPLMVSQEEELQNEESIRLALTRYSIINNDTGDQSPNDQRDRGINQWTDSYRKINQPSESNMRSLMSDKDKPEMEYNEVPTLPNIGSEVVTPQELVTERLNGLSAV